MISVDSLRFDALSCETEKRYLSLAKSELPSHRKTPVLDRLASEGAHFNCVITSAPYTSNAHASLFTGQWPWIHGVRSVWAQEPVSTSTALLAEILKARGFSTLSASGMPHIFHSEIPGLQRGIDRCVNLETHLLNRHFPDVLDWMDGHRNGRFFAFYHTTSVHDYMTKEKWRRFSRTGVQDPDAFYKEMRQPCQRPLPEQLVSYIDAVNFFDRNELNPIMRFLETSGLTESTLVVLLGDHGEPHPRDLREDEIRVPVIFWGAGNFPSGEKITAPVRLMDVFPTVMELLGLPPPRGLAAESLSPCWRGEEAAPREAYMELFLVPGGKALQKWEEAVTRKPCARGEAQLVLRGLRSGSGKILRDYRNNRWMFYDLKRDWAEEDPQFPAANSPLRSRLEEIERLDRRPGEPSQKFAQEPSPDVLRRLHQLGYLD